MMIMSHSLTVNGHIE
jgi:hypothetical protein